jgi:MFS family permease
MRDVTFYSPVRIALLALVRVVFGLMLGLAGAVVLWATAHGDFQPKQPEDMPHWWMYVVGSFFAFAGLAFVTGGIGRFVSAFARGCYFRAGPDGFAVRLPKYRWFGLFRIVEYRFQWHRIKRLVTATRRHNLIPMARELQIETYSGETVAVGRHFFTDNIKSIQQKLLLVQATVGH